MTVFAIFLVLHGLIHLLGFAKAFRLAALPELAQPISPLFGLLWLIAASLFIASAAALFLWPKWWWAIGACAIAVSMAAIVPSWADARFGAVVNAIVLAGVVFGFLERGPGSLYAEYEQDVQRSLTPPVPVAPVTETDLALLPEPIQRYLRTVGVVGQPRVRNFRVAMHGRIRNGPDARWMPFTAEQHNVVDEPARLFYMTASLFMIPAQGYHRFIGPSATMRVKAAAVVPMVDVSGKEMNQSETVTLFNDMCIMAPATLIDSKITWDSVNRQGVRATFANAGQTIRAELSFNEAGELTDFWSDDRYQLSPDGSSAARVLWSTPVSGYKSFGAVRLASGGEGRWHEPGREYAYIELSIDAVQYNLKAR